MDQIAIHYFLCQSKKNEVSIFKKIGKHAKILKFFAFYAMIVQLCSSCSIAICIIVTSSQTIDPIKKEEIERTALVSRLK